MGTLLVAGKRSEGVKCNYLQLAAGIRKKYIEKKRCNIAYHFVIEELQKKLRFGIGEVENSEPLF